jgi:hypothetical protein
MTLLVELSSGRNHWVGTYGPLLALYWTRALEPAVYLKLADYVKKCAERQEGGRLSVLSIALPGAQSPTSEGRRALVSLLRETDRCVSRVAIMREGQGFVASTVVSVMSGIQMLAKPNAGHKFFSSMREAVIWATADLPEYREGGQSVEETVLTLEKQRKSLSTKMGERLQRSERV